MKSRLTGKTIEKTKKEIEKKKKEDSMKSAFEILLEEGLITEETKLVIYPNSARNVIYRDDN